MDAEIDEEEDITLSPLLPDNLTDSIQLDLEDLLHIPHEPLRAISPIPGTSYRQETTHQFSTSNYDNLSVTPPISSLSLTPECALSPGHVLAPVPQSPGPDETNNHAQNESMDQMIDWYEIERDVLRPLGRRGLEETPVQCYNRDVILVEDIDNSWEKLDIDEVPDHGPSNLFLVQSFVHNLNYRVSHSLNFYLIRSKTSPTNDFESTVPEL